MAFWPFRRVATAEPLDDDTLSSMLAQLQFRMQMVEKQQRDATEACEHVKRLEPRILTCERITKSLESQREDDMARIAQSIDIVRGLATGSRGGRPPRVDPQIADVGQKVVAAMQDPEALARLIAELSALQHSLGGTQPVPFPSRGSPV
jgi:hypothetical protein